MCERAPHISIGSKICDTCRKKLSKELQDVTEPILSEPDLPSLPSSQATESDPLFSSASEAASSLNMYLAEIGETPYSQSKTQTEEGTVHLTLRRQSYGQLPAQSSLISFDWENSSQNQRDLLILLQTLHGAMWQWTPMMPLG